MQLWLFIRKLAVSNSENNPAERTLRKRLNLDDLTKLLGIGVAVLGFGKYFYDKAEAEAHEAQALSITYIESYGSDPMLGAREALYDFWIDQPELIKIFGSEEFSERQYRAIISSSLFRKNTDTAIRAPLLLLDNFYSQMSFCAKTGLCDKSILDAYFCRETKKNVVVYTPFYNRVREATGDQGIGAEMVAFADVCSVPNE
jgi:hypothetical protein